MKSSQSPALKYILLIPAIAAVVLVAWNFKKGQPDPLSAETGQQAAIATGTEPASQAAGSAIKAFSEWRTTADKEGHLTKELMEQGIQLAEARREAMLKLIRNNPDEALRLALSWSEWADLPAEIRNLVEAPFSKTGSYSVMEDCRPKAERSENPIHLVHFDDGAEQLMIYPANGWEGVSSKSSLPVQGIRIDQEAVLVPGVIQILNPADAEAVIRLDQEKFAGTDTSSSQTLALSGGELIPFDNFEEALEISSALASTLTMPGPRSTAAALELAHSRGDGGDPPSAAALLEVAINASLDWSATSKRVVVLRLDFSDNTGAPQSQATLQNHLSVSSDWLNEVSYGMIFLSSQVVSPEVFRLPKTTAEYDAISNWSTVLATDARALANAAGYDIDNNYDIVVYSFKKNDNIGGGFAQLGGRDHWESNGSIAVYTHEFGHNYGLPHANFWVSHQAGGDWNERDGEASEWGPAGNDEYGDVFDLMAVHARTRPGMESVWPNGHFDMKGKTYLGWINQSRVIDTTEAGIYRIHRFDHPDAQDSGNPLALTFQSDDFERYWVGFRRNFDSNATLSTGAYLVWENAPNQHRQIDCTPFSQIDGITASIETDPETGDVTSLYNHADFDRDDSALPVGASWTSPDGSVRLTNLGVGGAPPDEHIDLMIEYFGPPEELAPWGYYTDNSFTTKGLQGSYFNEKLRDTNEPDWTVSHTPTGSRIDEEFAFNTSSWGDRASLGITGGTDEDWDNYSVQWDGYVRITRPSVFLSLSMYSDDGSRLWLDLDENGTFEPSEELDNTFGYSTSTAKFSVGEYKIRIQYEEKTGGNLFFLYDEIETLGHGDFELYQDAALTTYGLNASFVNSSLRAVTSQADWTTTQTISGTRTESMPLYWDNTMGDKTPYGITGGPNDKTWHNFSVQYDGWIKVLRTTRFTTYGSDGARFWIDLDGSDSFATTAPEYHAGNWGEEGLARYAPFSGWVGPGTYKLRIQHELGASSNRFAFMGQPGSFFSIGRTMLLDGSKSASAPAGNPITGNFTVEAWIKPAHTGLMTVFSTRTPTAGYGFTFKIYSGTHFLAHIGGTSAWLESNALLAQNYRPGEWVHVAYSVRSDGYDLFLNGWLAGSGSFTPGTPVLLDATHPVSIGRDGQYGEEFNGQIDELRIWNYARNGQEIAATMRRTIPSTYPGLASCWRMEGNLTDLTGARDATPATTMSYAITRTPVNEQGKLLTPLPQETGVVRTGDIDYAGETDWFSIEVLEAGTLEFWSSGNLDTFGTLYRVGFGGELVEVDDVDYPDNPNFHVFYDAFPGTYYFGLSAFSDNTGPYTLNVNARDSIIPFALTINGVTVDGPEVALDSRINQEYFFLESDDLDKWNYLNSSPIAGTGGRMVFDIIPQAGLPRGFLRAADSKALFAAKTLASSSTAGSATILGQTGGFLFQPGIPENLGDTALLLDSEPMTQSGGVTIPSSASVSLGYSVITQSPGELSDDTAAFPAGVWIASNSSSGNEVFGVPISLAHFPFSDGWQGGHISAGGSYLKTNTPPGFNILPVQPGLIDVWMPSGEISPFDGALFVIGAENFSIPNVVSSGTAIAPDSSTIGWQVSITEANGPEGVPHGADWSFVYVPFATQGIAIGWVEFDGSVYESGPMDFTVTWDASNSRYNLQIPEFGDLSGGALILNALDNVAIGGGLSRPQDCHFQWELSPSGDTIYIYPRALPLQDQVPVQCGFVFAYIPFDSVIVGPESI